ncbi:MAG: Glycosyltransferase involved in cell wall bisynthesis [Verrucomicrobia bacterium]|nr:MAG: Glycosyltransferase involved in cell wall bisynthesis [Verrucomicrobiota bacterium]
MEKKLIFVNPLGECFTPTVSGSRATWIWEMCRAAQEFGIEPWVLTEDASAECLPWGRTVKMSCPSLLEKRFLAKHRCRGDLTPALQKKWIETLFLTIRKKQWHRATFVFHDAPETVWFLRASFPEAQLIHLFHKAAHCSSDVRKGFASSVDVAMAVSADCARWNEGYFGCAIHILRNGVDSKRFVPLQKTKKDRPLIGFVGSTSRQKAPDLLLRAALRLAEGFNGFDLQVLGSCSEGIPQKNAYQELLEALACRLEQRGVSVERPGFVNRLALPRLLARADIHVVPSRCEDPCPMSVLEGMATGQATVAAACGGIPEIVGSAGFLFERDDIFGLEARLRVLLQNEELRDSYGRRARERAQQRPWSLVCGELMEIVNF